MAKIKDILIVTSAAAVLIIAGVLFLAHITDRGNQPYSSHGSDPKGVKAFYLLLETFELEVVRWEQPLTRLPEEIGKVMILVEPTKRGIHPHEAASLRGWVEQGNRLLLLSTAQEALKDEFNLRMASSGNHGKSTLNSEVPSNSTLVKISPDPGYRKPHLFDKVELLALKRTRAFAQTGDATSLAAKGQDIYLLHQSLGEGEVISVADPNMITNQSLERTLDKSDNLIFLLNVMEAFDEPRPTYINEYHHGFGMERPLDSTSLGGWVLSYQAWPVFQLVLFTLVMLLTLGKRFSSPRALPTSSNRTLENLVASTAAVYHQADARQLAFRILYQGFMRSLLNKYRLSSKATLSFSREELAVQLGERITGKKREKLEEDFYQFSKALQGNHLSKKELQMLSARLDHYRKEFQL